MTLRLLCLASIAAVIAGCASASRANRAASCVLAPEDSVFLAGGTVYRDCAVDQRAQAVDRTPHPDFRGDASSMRDACYSAVVEFVVDEAGIPEMENARVVRTNSPQFAEATVAAIARWHYKPASRDGVPVRQIVTEKLTLATRIVVVRAGETPRPPTHAPLC